MMAHSYRFISRCVNNFEHGTFKGMQVFRKTNALE